MEIGNLGKLITFSVTSKKVLTFSSMNKNVKGRWSTHNIIGKRPKAEFLGPDRQQITLEVLLSSTLRVRPRKMIEKIEKTAEKGKPNILVIGGKRVGKYQWVIESVSEAWDKVIEDGRLVSAKVNLTLSEYL